MRTHPSSRLRRPLALAATALIAAAVLSGCFSPLDVLRNASGTSPSVPAINAPGASNDPSGSSTGTKSAAGDDGSRSVGTDDDAVPLARDSRFDSVAEAHAEAETAYLGYLAMLSVVAGDPSQPMKNLTAYAAGPQLELDRSFVSELRSTGSTFVGSVAVESFELVDVTSTGVTAHVCANYSGAGIASAGVTYPLLAGVDRNPEVLIFADINDELWLVSTVAPTGDNFS